MKERRRGGLAFTTNGKERGLLMHPFGRTSPLVANRPAKAGSLLSPACSTRDYSSNA